MLKTVINLSNVQTSKVWVGRVSYLKGLELQDDVLQKMEKNEVQTCILGFEHPGVVSIGVRGSVSRDVCVSAQELHNHGFELCQVSRGGEATLHNLGQLVIYPILPLKKLGIGVRSFVHILEQATRHCLRSFNVPLIPQQQEPGVHSIRGKIGFIGLRIKKGISSHGVSINVCNNLSNFTLIRSCGKLHGKHDRIIDWTDMVEPKQVYERWCDYFFQILKSSQTYPNEANARELQKTNFCSQ